MTHCRWTDRIADTVADPAAGVNALTAEEHAHIGRCAECFATVERLVHLDRALTGEMRALERGDLPRSVLSTPAYERRSRPPVLPVVLGGLAVAAAVLVVMVGSGLARNGLSWIGTGTVTPMPSASLVPSAEPSASPSLEPTPGAVPAAAVLEIGAIAAVVDEPLVVRTEPGATNASTITEDRLWLGQRVRLLEGPVEADGYPWWRVRVGEIEGWISAEEKDGSAPWISPIANGRIAFATRGGTEGATSNPDGSDLQPLFAEELLGGIDLVLSCGPSFTTQWSLDGTFLIVERSSGCEGELYRISADGSDIVNVASGSRPALSGDGQQIAFGLNQPYLPCGRCGENDGPWDIQTKPIDGSAAAAPVMASDPWFTAANPAWSPDGTAVAFDGYVTPETQDETVESQVWLVDDSSARQIASGHGPTWTPDGRWIIYGREEPGTGFTMLFRIRADGTGTEQEIASGDPWTVQLSPDGGKLAWSTHTMHGDFEAWVLPLDALDGLGAIGPDGASFARSSSPILIAWSPDGTQLAWSATTGDDPTPGIWVGNPDGSDATRIADGDAPSWQPILTDARRGR